MACQLVQTVNKIYLTILTCYFYCAMQAEKRAHHNALERKRRDHIKESFLNLRDAVPSLKGDKSSKGSSASVCHSSNTCFSF